MEIIKCICDEKANLQGVKVKVSCRCFVEQLHWKCSSLLVISQRLNQQIHLGPVLNGFCQYSLYSVLGIREEKNFLEYMQCNGLHKYFSFKYY